MRSAIAKPMSCGQAAPSTVRVSARKIGLNVLVSSMNRIEYNLNLSTVNSDEYGVFANLKYLNYIYVYRFTSCVQ